MKLAEGLSLSPSSCRNDDAEYLMAVARRGAHIALGLIKWILKLNPRWVADVLAVLAILAVAAVLWRHAPVYQWAVGVLAYAWIPVSIWAGAASITLRFRRRLLWRYWRWWCLTAGAVVASSGTLSLLQPQFGLMSEVSLGGQWGSVIGGSPLALGILLSLIHI